MRDAVVLVALVDAVDLAETGPRALREVGHCAGQLVGDSASHRLGCRVVLDGRGDGGGVTSGARSVRIVVVVVVVVGRADCARLDQDVHVRCVVRGVAEHLGWR